jgi:hypothetical protein
LHRDRLTCYAGRESGSRIIYVRRKTSSGTSPWQQFGNSITAQIVTGQHGTHLANFVEVQQRIGLTPMATSRNRVPIVSRVAGLLGGGSTPCDNASEHMRNAWLALPGGTGGTAGANLSNASQSYNALQAVLQKRMGNDYRRKCPTPGQVPD